MHLQNLLPVSLPVTRSNEWEWTISQKFTRKSNGESVHITAHGMTRQRAWQHFNTMLKIEDEWIPYNFTESIIDWLFEWAGRIDVFVDKIKRFFSAISQ